MGGLANICKLYGSMVVVGNDKKKHVYQYKEKSGKIEEVKEKRKKKGGG